jgi:hypothetical protein
LDFYSLKGTSVVPQTLSELKTWLGKDWDGKIYVATSVIWDGCEFQQHGCSPNYMAGWWSLACCKHQMRASIPFKEKAFDYKKHTYIFTLAKQFVPRQPQSLVSIARITNHFEAMKEYAVFLRNKGGKLLSSRLSCEFSDDGMFGWRFGDCHTDLSGNVGRPHKNHIHAEGGQWKKDCPEKKQSRDHLILVSNKFIVWQKPVFKARHVFGRGGNGDRVHFSVPVHELVLGPG